MSARRLWVRFRTVESGRRPAYADAVTAAGERAAELGAYFWVFETDGDSGEFVEFLEGPSDETVRATDRATGSALSDAGGGAPRGMTIGPEGFWCTELRGA